MHYVPVASHGSLAAHAAPATPDELAGHACSHIDVPTRATIRTARALHSRRACPLPAGQAPGARAFIDYLVATDSGAS